MGKEKANYSNIFTQRYVPRTSIMFVSQASMKLGVIDTYGIKKRVEAVRNCRKIGKADMKYNSSTPRMKVDPESYVSFFPPLFLHHSSVR